MRNWKEKQNDEIFAIWKEYLRTDGFTGDHLFHESIRSKPIRLTMHEIVRLVEELMDRLEIKAWKTFEDEINEEKN
jgi:hypothetical protein